MRKIFTFLTAVTTLSLLLTNTSPVQAAATGIYPSGGGTQTAGNQFTITVVASGASFDSLQGTISVSGPATIVSFSAGGATWLPGKTPANGKQFVGITSATTSLTVARITLQGTQPGSGSVSITGVQMASAGSIVGTSGGTAYFTIQRALVPAGSVSVSSSSHPDQGQAYEATKIDLSWNQASGVVGFGYVLDQSEGTAAPQTVTSADTSISYPDKAIGTYYFHIRAKNGDGWGPTTTFKITIKEPDPKVNDTLLKPRIITVAKETNFQTDLDKGLARNFTLSGLCLPGYTVNLSFTPTLVPSGPQSTSTTCDTTGHWSLTINQLVPAGFYQVTAQGQQQKVLTPVGDQAQLEISIAKGGNVQLITGNDAVPTPTPTPSATPTNKFHLTSTQVSAGLGGTLALLVFAAGFLILRRRKAPGKPNNSKTDLLG